VQKQAANGISFLKSHSSNRGGRKKGCNRQKSHSSQARNSSQHVGKKNKKGTRPSHCSALEKGMEKKKEKMAGRAIAPKVNNIYA